jgi:hypothetical protein
MGMLSTVRHMLFSSDERRTTLHQRRMRISRSKGWRRLEVTTPPLPQFDGTMAFYQREGFSIAGGRKLKLELP